MVSQRFDSLPDSTAELAALLERSGVDFRRTEQRICFRFSDRGHVWQTVCDGHKGLLLAYGIHPAPVRGVRPALELCSQLNREVVEGGFFLQEERFVFRTGARLTEFWDAQERIAHALEYNAAVISRFWERLAACAGRTGAAGPFQKSRP